MWQQFFLQDFHVILCIFVALVMGAIAWLYLDAWLGHHAKKELFKWTGFVVLALSFIAQAMVVEQSVLGESLLGDITEGLAVFLRVAGYVLVLVGNVIDPLQVIPKNRGLDLETIAESTKKRHVSAGGFLAGSAVTLQWLAPIAGLFVAVHYWLRATKGLERHLKRVAWGFGLIAMADLLKLASLLRDTNNPSLYNMVQAFGLVWMIQHVVLLSGAVVLGVWIWSYLTKRFFSQVFLILITITVSVFFVVTVSFTALLLRSVRADMVSNQKTAAQVLGYALSAKKSETMAVAKQFAAKEDALSAVRSKDHNALISLTNGYMASQRMTSMIITDASGQVLLRAQDMDQWGDSVASDTLFRRALLGESSSSLYAANGVVHPTMHVRSVATMKDHDGTVVGTVATGIELDAAFVDGIRASTGLESSVYSGDSLAATTLLTTDGKTRGVGLRMVDKRVVEQVMDKGQVYDGEFAFQNRGMIGAFLPIKDIDNATIGMLMVGQPQAHVLQIAGRSMELTYVVMVLLLALAAYPLFRVTRLVVRQL